MFTFLDIVLSIIHLAIVGFNLFGWIRRSARKVHLVSIALTASSWLILGIWYGIGYCPITDWQWRVKAKLGETNLPSNFIEYFAEKVTGIDFDPELVNSIIMVSFILVTLISVCLNFLLPLINKKYRRT